MSGISVRGSRGNTYHVHMGQDGSWVCSCPAWRFQRVPGNARQCKHIRQLAANLASHLQVAARG